MAAPSIAPVSALLGLPVLWLYLLKPFYQNSSRIFERLDTWQCALPVLGRCSCLVSPQCSGSNAGQAASKHTEVHNIKRLQ